MFSLFISKGDNEIGELKAFCDNHDWNLTSKSLLRFEAVDFEINHPFEVLFFGSPRSVMFFLKKFSIPTNVEIGCVGEVTAKLIQSLGYNVGFIGQGNDTSLIANAFQSFVSNRRVLFPISDRSLRSISSSLDPDMIEEIVVYKTLEVDTEIDEHDIYVFTSPSNFHAYIKSNTILKSAYVIAWGNSTKMAIQLTREVNHTLSKPSITALVDHLKTIIK